MDSAAAWVSAASHFLMTLSIATSLALYAQASTLALLRRHLADQHTNDTRALYVLMIVVSISMWLSLWLYRSWAIAQRVVSTGEEKSSTD